MHQRIAPACFSIKLVTATVLLLAAALIAAAFRSSALVPAASIFLLIIGVAYLLSPAGYSLTNGMLVVERRWGSRAFGPVVRCSIPGEKPRSFTLRLWGNGGFIAGTGIYWNRRWGIFRAYVTRAKYDEYVLVETADKKILISPEDPPAFVRDAGCAGTVQPDTEGTEGPLRR